MPDANVVLQLINVTKSYAGVDGDGRVAVLQDISLGIPASASVAIVGPSGSGKSTLLNIIGTLDRPTSGSVLLDGADLAKLDEDALATVRNRRIGFIFQGHHLLPQCTVLENVLVPVLAAKDAELKASSESRARRLLDRVGLGARLWHRPGQLSGGERQRVAVVRALINQPKLLLADEPTGALDRVSAGKLGELLVELNREEGVTLIVVTHAPDLARRMSHTFELCDGALVSH
jgi:predicted ABC-type transport system involved in lysophospholipase L1 biosynthesis ATPase subunit